MCMKWIQSLAKFWLSIPLSLIVVFLSTLYPLIVFAADVQFTPAVSDVVERFSVKYCSEISNGGDPEKAAEVASRQMISSLIFSGVLKEVMAASKEDLTEFVSTEIIDTCGDGLSISRQELNDYLFELAQSGDERNQSQQKPFRPFGVG